MNLPSDLRSFLRSLDRETLAELLYEQAGRDPDLRQRLVARAGGTSNGDLTEVSSVLDDEVRAAESVQLASVLDTLQRLLNAGTQADVAPLARRTVDKIITALAEDGPADGMDDQLARAVSLYARACVAHPSNSQELADWIVQVAFGNPGWPEISLLEFAPALTEESIQFIKSTVGSVLAEPFTGDGGKRRRTAQRLRQEVAEITGDVDTVVRLLSEQLPRLDVSLKIVRVLRAAGRHSEAIAYAAQARMDDEGARRGLVADPSEQGSQRPAELVHRLLCENDDEQAWKIAREGSPAEIIPVYRQQIEPLIEQRNPRLYARAAARLRRLRMLHRRAGTTKEFICYLTELVERHKRKTRLLAELHQAGITLPKSARR